MTPRTVAHQAHPFTRQEYGVGCHSLLQGIFPTQGSTQVSQIADRLYQLSHQKSQDGHKFCPQIARPLQRKAIQSQTCNRTTQGESRVCVCRKGGGEVLVLQDAQNDVGVRESLAEKRGG